MSPSHQTTGEFPLLFYCANFHFPKKCFFIETKLLLEFFYDCLPPSLPPMPRSQPPVTPALNLLHAPLPLGTLGPHMEARTPTPAGRVCQEGASLHVREPVRESRAERKGLGMGHQPPVETGPAGKADPDGKAASFSWEDLPDNRIIVSQNH